MPKAWRMTGCAPGNEQCVCLSSEGSVQRNDTWVAQNRAGKTCTGFEGSGNARRRRAKGTLAQLVRDGAAPQNSPLSVPKPGTVLVRDWCGVTHQGKVLEDGLLFRSKRYKSLSEVARVITGSRWSGPLFFGLKSAVKERSHGIRQSLQAALYDLHS